VNKKKTEYGQIVEIVQALATHKNGKYVCKSRYGTWNPKTKKWE